MIESKSVSIIVKGRVQGVAYRYYTQMKATELNLDGSVKNRMDGTVYICASGHAEPISQLIKWCNQGSPASEVVEVVVEELPLYEIKSTGFTVIR